MSKASLPSLSFPADSVSLPLNPVLGAVAIWMSQVIQPLFASDLLVPQHAHLHTFPHLSPSHFLSIHLLSSALLTSSLSHPLKSLSCRSTSFRYEPRNTYLVWEAPWTAKRPTSLRPLRVVFFPIVYCGKIKMTATHGEWEHRIRYHGVSLILPALLLLIGN